jgi:hypothetical protein
MAVIKTVKQKFIRVLTPKKSFHPHNKLVSPMIMTDILFLFAFVLDSRYLLIELL